MKGLLVVVCLFLVAAVVRAGDKEKYTGAVKEGIKECATKDGLSESDLENIYDGSNRKVACAQACVMNKYKLMEGGKVVREKLFGMIDGLSGDEPAKVMKYKAASNDCEATANAKSDECDVAQVYLQCIIKVIS